MAEQNDNVWAPWRMQYIESLDKDEDAGGCFLCRYASTPDADRENHVLIRSERTLVLLNRFPYTNGHLLVAPAAHVADPLDLPEDVLFELSRRLCDAKRVLDRVLTPQGYNLGMNLGRCGGAGLPEHLHWHIVPRWGGDTNYMSVVADVRVIPQSLDELHKRFLDAATQLGV